MNRFLIFTILTFCGAAIRCFIDVKFGAVTTQHSLATFSINIAGAFIAGIFMSIGESGYWSREMTITFIGGFCGALTTLSGLSAQSLVLIETGHAALAIGLLSLTAGVGCGFVFIGRAFGRFAGGHF